MEKKENEHKPYQIITRIYQEEDQAKDAFKLLVKSGFAEDHIKITIYNPLNSIRDLQGNENTEYIGDGSRDEYILSLTADSAIQAALAHQLL